MQKGVGPVDESALTVRRKSLKDGQAEATGTQIGHFIRYPHLHGALVWCREHTRKIALGQEEEEGEAVKQIMVLFKGIRSGKVGATTFFLNFEELDSFFLSVCIQRRDPRG